MKIETERLFIYPVGDEEMKALIENTQDAELKQAYSEMLAGCTDHPESRVWYAAWYMELKGSGGTVIGDLCFKGIISSCPNCDKILCGYTDTADDK